ncbi:MAG: hypothetical protein JSS57_21360 [Proteobacteria bacterium]|nr:hypothetical protein [Pseudomonadota bacterium]
MAAFSLAGCRDDAPKAAAEPAFRPTASIQEIMQSIVDPSADALWESVSSTVTAKGVEDKQPRTDEEWTAVRHLAIQLAEAANLLAVEGRPLVHAGKQLEDAHVAGILKPDEIGALIGKERPRFVTHARHLQQAAEEALAAIDARSVERLTVAGGSIDQACEACHRVFWYPNDKRPPELAGTAAPVTK